MTWRKISQLLVAFAGLALALDLGGAQLNPAGLALAGMAALTFALLLLINGRILQGRNSRPATMHTLGMGAVIFWIADLGVGELPLPATGIGMAAFIGAGLFYTFAIITLFCAVAMIGSVRVALFMNFEPMTALQLAGAALVVVAIIWAGVPRLPA